MVITKERVKKVGGIKVPLSLIAVVLIVIIIGGIILFLSMNQKPKTEIVTVSSLEKVVDLSELSTFEAVYDGVAEVKNERNEKKTDYYVSYESKIKAGIDFQQIQIEVNSDEKKVIITLPKATIDKDDINVDITSLDYMFMNDKANKEGVSANAYKACIADVQKEVTENSSIIELAEENAKNIVKALVEPFLNQMDAEYVLEVK